MGAILRCWRKTEKREKIGPKSAAIKLYGKRKNEALQGRKLPETLRSIVRVSDLAPALLRDYRVNKNKPYDSVERQLRKHVLPFFGALSVNDVDTKTIDRYVDCRKAECAENATINREIAALKRMYNLARRSALPKIQQIPAFPHLKENAPRQGFVEDQQYFILSRKADEPWLKAALAVAYTFGFRKSELLLKMTVRQVDLKARSIRLYAGTTKNDEGRTVKMTSEVHGLLEACIRGKSAHDFVFTRKNGEPVRDFRGSWYTLCERSGLGRFVKGEDEKKRWEGLIFHDFRRSAVRNMIRSGVSEKVAMKISGHKTRSVFDRYNIVNESDIEEAAMKIENGREKVLADPSATTTATSLDDRSEHKSTEPNNDLYIQ